MSDVAAQLREMNRKLDTLSQLIVPIFTRKVSQKTLARRAGVHPSTISRRKRRARHEAILAGAIST